MAHGMDLDLSDQADGRDGKNRHVLKHVRKKQLKEMSMGACTHRSDSDKDRRTGCDRRQADYTVLLDFDRRTGSDRREDSTEKN